MKNFICKILFNQKTMALAGLIIIALISIPLSKNIKQEYKIDNEIKELEEEIAELEGKGSNLKKMISYLESDQFIEEKARLDLGLKKEGEEVAVIDFKKTESTGNTNIENKNLDNKKNNMLRWWIYFFN
ncbi:MAG: septum formation initiator family protein [Candidatus Falkowbacteria bacterium]